MRYNQNIEIEHLLHRLAKLIGYYEAQAYYERVNYDAYSATRSISEYIKEKLTLKIHEETLVEVH